MGYKDASLPTEERVRDLVARMSAREKGAQLGSLWVYELTSDSAFDEGKATNIASRDKPRKGGDLETE